MKWFILALFIVCATVVHFRGRVRHRFSRQALDHSTFTAPLNCFMYAFSSVPNQPYLDLKDFPELKVLLDRCDEIREEALRLFGDGISRHPTSTTTPASTRSSRAAGSAST